MTDGPFGSKLKSSHYVTAGVRVIRLGNVGVGCFNLEDRSYISQEYAAQLARHAVAAGDLVIAALAEPVGRCCEVPTAVLPAIVKADCIRFRPKEDVAARFIMHWLNSPAGAKNAEAHSHGVGRLRINMQEMRSLAVPLPPIPEQHRIVAEIEKHFTRLDEAVATLEGVKAKLKQARASVLKAAVEGRLVPTEAELARAEGRSHEPASVLLERILEERRRRWPEEKKLQALVTPQTGSLSPLPEGWCWAMLESLGEVVTGTTPKTSEPENYAESGLPFVKPTDLDAGPNVASARQFLTLRGADGSRPIPALSVLVTCIGATIGKTGLARVRCATNQQINALVPAAPLRESRYCFWLLCSPIGQDAILSNASSTTLPIINKSRFGKLVAPLPPLAEQARIVADVERRLSVLDALDGTVEENLARCGRLRQSILKRAFEGKLVPQDPRDEPASELLARIKAGRAAEVTA